MSAKRLHPQAGVIITLFAIALPVLIGLLVLAIDCGNLYLARSRLTKVVRVSSATALNMMALRGWGALVAEPESPPSSFGLKTADITIEEDGPLTFGNRAVVQEIRQSAIDALAAYYPADFNKDEPNTPHEYFKFKDRNGALHSGPQLSAINRLNSSVSMVYRYAVRTYFLGAISDMLGDSQMCTRIGDETSLRCWVESLPTDPNSPTGRMKSANVFMLLDVSGSMNEQVGGRTKSSRLVEAAANFIDMFNPYHDKFAIIPYATSADTGQVPTMAHLNDLESRQSEGGFLKAKMDISRLDIGGQTNQCDALIQVIRSIEEDEALQDPSTPKFVLLFSDGAPNVYRLGFCEDGECTPVDDPADTPPHLATALNLGGRSAREAALGWYGWTVKWDKREVFRIGAPHDTCPTDGSGGDEISPAPGHAIPDCDPVWAFPKVVGIEDGAELPYEVVSQRLRLNEDGDFILTGAPYNGRKLSELGYQLKFRDWEGTGPLLPDYQYPDAYRWHGPSYLVHASFNIPRGISLIDRIPRSLEDGGTPAITCGPGSRSPFPGHQTQTAPVVADKYNHARYFASRVVDRDWRWNGSFGNDSSGKATKTGLTLDQRRNAPSYFMQPHTLQGNPHDSPGCLGQLSAKVPFTEAEIHMGDNFVSNTATTIRQRGEAVKTAELPYYCALRAADWLRSQYNVVIFVVGLGQRADDLYGTSCEDPLQNALDPNSRKDRFLRRLAFAPETLTDPISLFEGSNGGSWLVSSDFGFSPRRSLSSCTNHPLAGLTVEIGYKEENKSNSSGFSPGQHGFTSDHLGAYYGANNPDDLKMLFGEIAKRMLLRLAT
jgi:hypothetical protein